MKVPAYFFGDHYDRSLPTPVVLRRLGRCVEIADDDPAIRELLDDARYYADPLGPDGIDDGGKLIRSAKATVRAIEAALRACGEEV